MVGSRALRLLASDGPLTARQIADRLGLPKGRRVTATVSTSLRNLRRLGRVTAEAVGPARASGVGVRWRIVRRP